jgi:cell division protein ZapA (FtsZ GTPase activity inhibitor)
MAKSELRFDILGASFSITADEDPVYLESLMGRYRRVIENTQKTTGLKEPLKVAILAGFLLCDEIEKLAGGSGGAHEALEAERLTLDLIARLDTVIGEKTTRTPE